MDAIEKRICEIIDKKSEEIIAFGRDIWLHAETGYKEVRTAAVFAEALERLGAEVETGVAITGVTGRFDEKREGLSIALMGELDALPISAHVDANPETGASHCCGHNAQLTGVLGAAMALSDPEIREALGGNVIFMAVPAEEFVEVEYKAELRKSGKIRYGGGKCEFIRLGVMDGVDITVGHHSSPGKRIGVSNGSSNGFVSKLVRFIGKSAHAAGSPHMGQDALAAAGIAMHAIDVQRETFRDKDTVRVHGFISRGGEAVNVIADNVTLEYLVRAKNIAAMKDADMKVNRALRAGAIATGCGLEIDTVPGYLPTVPLHDVSVIEEAAAEVCGDYEVRHMGAEHHGTGSTDYGDLSSIMPLVQFGTGGFKGVLHNPEISVDDEYLAYVVTAKMFALLAYKLLKNGGARGKELCDGFKPLMTKDEYLAYMESMLSLEQIERQQMEPLTD